MASNEYIIESIKKVARETLPPKSSLLLFGSRARHEEHANSDWDILIILDKEELLPSDYDNVTYPLTELGWELGKEINPVMYSAKEWQKYKNSLFYKNVEKDGIKLWG